MPIDNRPEKPFTYEEFREIYSKVPRLCIDLVIPRPAGVVMTLRTLDSWKGLWHLPGGTLYYRESVKDAVRRIGQEELGVTVSADGLLGYIEYPSEAEARGFGWSVALVILCVGARTPITLNAEASEYGCFIVPPPNTVPEQRRFLKENWERIYR